MPKSKFYKTSDSTHLAYDIFIKMTFGDHTPLGSTPSDLKNLCKRMIEIIGKAIEININTDKNHSEQIIAALRKLQRALKDPDFEPLYIVGLFQIIFLLLGDLPSNWRRIRRVSKNKNFFLKSRRELVYTRSLDQKVTTILRAHTDQKEFIDVAKYWQLTELFRKEGGKETYSVNFVNWYSEKFPVLYSKLF